MKQPFSNRERGAVLVISLLMLLIMTILAISISQTTTLEERMAGNFRDINAAFQASEAGLRAAEKVLENTPLEEITICDDLSKCQSASLNFYYDVDLSLPDETGWWESNGVEYGTSGQKDLAEVSEDPRYIVEKRGEQPDDLLVESQSSGKIVYYEVTSHGYGRTNTAEVVAQSIYAKR